MHEEFKCRVERLSTLVKDGARTNHDEIMHELSGFPSHHEALRYFLTSAISDPSRRRLLSAQSFFLYANDHMLIRINAWYPQSGRSGNLRERFDSFFTIDRCHNHSADFFTVGILGPGYTSEFKETSQDLEQVSLGDKITFDRVWEDQLNIGKTIFLPKGSLFHTQFAPKEYSMSLNLIVDNGASCLQFELGEDRETVTKVYDFVEGDQVSRQKAAF